MMCSNVKLFTGLVALAAALVAAPAARAAAVDVKVELPNIRTIQTNTVGEGKTDDIYLLVTGVANGAAVTKQFPEGKTWKASSKAPAVTEKSPLTIWEGKLDEGQFIALTVAAFAGDKIDDAKRKDYFEKKAASDKKVEALAAAKIADAKAAEALRLALNKQNVAFFKAIGDIFPKRKGDNYVGAFDVIVTNIGGKVVKRLMPTGLLSGEHFGVGVKQYSKLKYTRENVLIQDKKGQWYEMQLEPWGENDQSARVKMTEVEMVGDVRTVTDYLVDVKIAAAGKPLVFEFAGEVNPVKSIVHNYWEWAE